LWLWWLLTILSEARLSVASFKVRPSLYHMWRKWFKKRRDDDKDIVHKQAGGETAIYAGSETVTYIDSHEGSGGSIGGDGGDGGGGNGGGGNGGG